MTKTTLQERIDGEQVYWTSERLDEALIWLQAQTWDGSEVGSGIHTFYFPETDPSDNIYHGGCPSVTSLILDRSERTIEYSVFDDGMSGGGTEGEFATIEELKEYVIKEQRWHGIDPH